MNVRVCTESLSLPNKKPIPGPELVGNTLHAGQSPLVELRLGDVVAHRLEDLQSVCVGGNQICRSTLRFRDGVAHRLKGLCNGKDILL